MKYRLGRLELPNDSRDRLSRELLLPPTTLVRQFWGMDGPDMRMDQGQEGTCEGHAHTALMINGPSTHPGFPSWDTPEDAHLFARKLYLDATGDETYQKGANTRQVLDTLVKRGMVGTYFRTTSVSQLIHTILTLGPVCHGSNWYNSMFSPVPQLDNYYLTVDEASGIAGGHIVCITGINLDPPAGPPYARIENSWGPSWGKDGTARVTIDDLQRLFVGDAFVVTEEVF